MFFIILLAQSIFIFCVFFFVSARKPFRTFNARTTFVIGLTGGFLYSIMRSTQRLAGLEPNDAEVARYGYIPASVLAETEERRQIRNLNLIDTEAADISKRAVK